MADRTSTILFVDDDAGNRQALGMVLRQAGFAVLEASGGRETLELAHTRRPDIIVLDVNLPDLSGFEVCRQLRADPATRSICILHLSAVYVGARDRSQGLEGGADAYLTKPVDPGELLATVKALLRVRVAEEAARLASHQWRATFDAILDPVVLLDVGGRICRCNRALAQLLGQSFDRLIGRSLQDVLREAFALERIRDFRTPKGDDGEASEIQLGSRWFRVRSNPIHDDPSLDAGSVVILTDVTQHRRLEEQLLQSQKLEALGRLAGGIAHDFNNLLTAILGNTALLRSRLPEGEPDQHLVAVIDQAAWRAAELTRQLLGFSRQTLLWLQPVEVAGLLAEVGSAVRPRLPARVSANVQHRAGSARIQADPAQLAHILTHLCINAVDAMPEGGEVTLASANVSLTEEQASQNLDTRAGSFVRLSVADTGEGIAPEVLDKIFDPFFTTKPVGQGSGLGLAMVYGIVKQHKGWVRCESTLGRGTCFELYFPRADEDPPRAEPRSAAGVVLLADDDETLRALASAYLAREGYEVLQAGDGREAVELFHRERHRIDVVVLDTRMPHLSGRQALEELRLIGPHVPVLLACGSVDEPGPREGIVGVVVKPYRERELVQSVRATMKRP